MNVIAVSMYLFKDMILISLYDVYQCMHNICSLPNNVVII